MPTYRMQTHGNRHGTTEQSINQKLQQEMEKVYLKQQQKVAHMTNNQNTNKVTITQIILEWRIDIHRLFNVACNRVLKYRIVATR
jgi:hypothetical protein